MKDKYINDIKIFAKNKKEQIIKIYSQDIGMEYPIENVPCL